VPWEGGHVGEGRPMVGREKVKVRDGPVHILPPAAMPWLSAGHRDTAPMRLSSPASRRQHADAGLA